jgi:hypothetical protein
MQIAEILPGFQGKELEIRQAWEEESDGPGVNFVFEGNRVRVTSILEEQPMDWEPQSLRRTVQIAIHRVLPDVKIVWLSV